MSNLIAIVGEGPTDHPVTKELIDHTLLRCAEIDWINDEADLTIHVTYRGLTERDPFIKWSQIDTDTPKDYRRAVRSMFGADWPPNDAALRTQRVLFDFLSRSSDAGEAPPYIVIVKDTESNADLREQLRAVRAMLEVKKLPAVLGIQDTELECWILCGFEPETDTEQKRLSELCRGEFPPGVGFNPCEKSHQLTATKKDHEKLSPKRVLKHLTNNDRGRELKGLHKDRHPILKARGTENGLADFLQDVEARLVPNVFGVRCG